MTPSIVSTPVGSRREAAQQSVIPALDTMSGYRAFDHVLWYVGNAKQAASYYVTRMGFNHVAYVSQIWLPI